MLGSPPGWDLNFWGSRISTFDDLGSQTSRPSAPEPADTFSSIASFEIQVFRQGRRCGVVGVVVPVVPAAEDHVDELFGPALDPSAITVRRQDAVGNPSANVSGGELVD